MTQRRTSEFGGGVSYRTVIAWYEWPAVVVLFPLWLLWQAAGHAWRRWTDRRHEERRRGMIDLTRGGRR